MREARRPPVPVPAILAFCLVPVLFHVAILAIIGFEARAPGLLRFFKFGVVSVAALSHWAIYGALLLSFGLTLRPGRQPIISMIARRMHGPLAPELARYTRGVTIAWSGFFFAQLALSVGLFCFAPLRVWSFFVNILDIPLVVTMFACEYAFRLRYLKNPPRHSLREIIAMVDEMRKPARPTIAP